MKAVLISIQPKWCELIASGKKTLEVRKTRPKLETPFKVYIYCTLPPKTELFTHGCIREYANELIHLQSGEIVYGYGMQLCLDPKNRPYTKDNFLCRKVIGEFICDSVNQYSTADHVDGVDISTEDVTRMSCLTKQELEAYEFSAEPKEFSLYMIGLYCWHISDLKIYDKPKELSDFRKPFPFHKDCSSCDRGGTSFHPETCYGCGHFDGIDISRPPQSWCYVEEI